MKCTYGYSTNKDINLCVKEATKDLHNPELIVFFSDVPSFRDYTIRLQRMFPEACVMGSTSHVEVCTGGCFYEGLVLASFEDGVTFSTGVIDFASRKSADQTSVVEEALFEMRAMEAIDNTVCLEFCAALKNAEEQLLVELNSVLLYEGIKVFGGSAGDDYSAVETLVSLNGRIYDNSCVFVLLHNSNGSIHYYRENIFKPLSGVSHAVTKADAVRRTVYELDHEPVLSVYAKELGVTEEEAVKLIDLYPFGKMAGEELYVVSNKSVKKDGSFKYHARVHGGTEMMVLTADDYRKITAETLEMIKSEVPNPTFVLSCQCIARMILLAKEQYTDEYTSMQAAAFGGFLGFSGYGEQLGTRHFNETQCIMVFE